MDAINARFCQHLEEKQFSLRFQDQSDQCVYRGKFALSQYYLIDFAVSLSKSETKSLGQIVFHKIAYDKDREARREWLDYLNAINQHQAVYYTFMIDDNDYVFMRYMTEVTPDTVATFLNILIQGPTILKALIADMEEHFGPFVIM